MEGRRYFCAAMKTRILLTALLLVSCTGLESSQDRRGSGTGPAAPETPAARDTTIYFSLVEYSGGYSWRTDFEVPETPPTVTLYKNFEPVLTLEACDKSEISADFDSHIIRGGHLYTKFAGHGRTVVKRDGNTLFSYEGEESIEDFLFRGDTLYTLGRKIGSEGFSLRRDGEPVFTSEEGSFYGSLHCDDGHICFPFHRTVGTDSFDFIVRDDACVQVAPLGGTTTLDIRMFEGTIHKLYLTGSGEVWLQTGDTARKVCDASDGWGTPTDASLCVLPDGIGVLYEQMSGTQGSATLWREGSIIHRDVTDSAYLYPDGPGMVCYNGSCVLVCWSAEGGANIKSGTWYFFSRNCAALCEGVYYMALTPRADFSRPSICVGNAETEIESDGVLTSIEVICS